MAEQTASQTGLGRRLWDLLGHYSTASTLFPIAAAFVVAARRIAHMPSDWYPPQYWVSAGAWGFSTWALAAAGVRGINWAVPKIKRWRNPHAISVELNVGNNVELVLTHSGEAATWYADARIIKTVDTKEKNPDPTPYNCEIVKGSGSNTKMLMKEGEFSTITIATVKHDSYGHRPEWLAIVQRHSVSIAVPNSGVIIEVKIKSVPPAESTLVKYYKVYRNRLGDIETEDISKHF